MRRKDDVRISQFFISDMFSGVLSFHEFSEIYTQVTERVTAAVIKLQLTSISQVSAKKFEIQLQTERRYIALVFPETALWKESEPSRDILMRVVQYTRIVTIR